MFVCSVVTARFGLMQHCQGRCIALSFVAHCVALLVPCLLSLRLAQSWFCCREVRLGAGLQHQLRARVALKEGTMIEQQPVLIRVL